MKSFFVVEVEDRVVVLVELLPLCGVVVYGDVIRVVNLVGGFGGGSGYGLTKTNIK